MGRASTLSCEFGAMRHADLPVRTMAKPCRHGRKWDHTDLITMLTPDKGGRCATFIDDECEGLTMRKLKTPTKFCQANGRMAGLLKAVRRDPRRWIIVGALWFFAFCSFSLGASAQQDAGPQSPSPPTSAPSAAVGWKQSLVTHVAKQQRYPAEARGRQGVVNIAFTLNRQGGVANSRIAKSSGSPVLDAEALDMIKRAAPFPTPPTEIPDSELSFVIPIQFAARQ
jgi:TonB family protein